MLTFKSSRSFSVSVGFRVRRTVVQRLIGSFTSLLIAGLSFGQNSAPAARSTTDDKPPVELPKMAITVEKLRPELLIPNRDLALAGFRSAPPELVFPHQARHEDVLEGYATVGVMLDATGKASDFLILKYTKRYFADELITAFRNEAFTPRRVRGVAVPGRLTIAQRFNSSQQVQRSANSVPPQVFLIGDALDRMFAPALPRYVYQPHQESETDSKRLQFTAVSVPAIPADFRAEEGKPVKIVASFYVDEAGDVRLPNIESNGSPLLTHYVLDTISSWKFVPPTIKGTPVLVFAIRSIILDPAALTVGPAPQHG